MFALDYASILEDYTIFSGKNQFYFLNAIMFYLDILTVLYYHNLKEDPDLCILPCYSPMTAKDMGVDIAASFHNDYKNVEDFETKNRVKLPEDIAVLLRGE